MKPQIVHTDRLSEGWWGEASPCAAIGCRATGTVAPTGRYAATPSTGLCPVPRRKGSRLSGCLTLFVLWVLVMGCMGCDIALPIDDTRQRQRIEEALRHDDFETAGELLQDAFESAPKREQIILHINQAVIELRSGQCEAARRRMFELLHQPQAKPHQSWIHYLIAKASLCEALPDNQPSETDYAMALEHFFLAESHGMDCRREINAVLARWFPSCESLQDDMSRSAGEAGTALDYDGVGHTMLTVCASASVWIKFSARSNEIIYPSLLLRSLERRAWMDDSSRLPYSQVAMRLYGVTPSGLPSEVPLSKAVMLLPQFPPQDEDYRSGTLALPYFVVPEGQTQFFIEVSAANLGEARFHLSLQRRVDCRTLDDALTYDDDLAPLHVWLHPDASYRGLVLCPGRPDHFMFTVPALQSGGIVIRPDMSDAMAWEIWEETPRHEGMPEAFKEKEVRVFLPNRGEGSPGEAEIAPTVIVVHNLEPVAKTYHLTLKSSRTDAAPSYHIDYVQSEPCLPGAPPEGVMHFPMHVLGRQGGDNRSEIVAMGWICKDASLRLEPDFSGSPATITRADVIAHVLSHAELLSHDVMFESLLRADNALAGMGGEFLAEVGRTSAHAWWEGRGAVSKIVSRPMTAMSALRLGVRRHEGFYLLMLRAQSSGEDRREDNQEESDNRDGEDEDDSRGKDDPAQEADQNPQDPSESPAAPKGPGTDTQGQDSTPDESASNHGASKFDPDAFERDRVEEMLDAIERGDNPLPGQGMIRRSDGDGKNW